MIGEPRHTGLFELAVAVGKAFTVTDVVAKAVHPFVFSTTTVYVPVVASVAFKIVGFCTLLVNLGVVLLVQVND